MRSNHSDARLLMSFSLLFTKLCHNTEKRSGVFDVGIGHVTPRGGQCDTFLFVSLSFVYYSFLDIFLAYEALQRHEENHLAILCAV